MITKNYKLKSERDKKIRKMITDYVEANGDKLRSIKHICEEEPSKITNYYVVGITDNMSERHETIIQVEKICNDYVITEVGSVPAGDPEELDKEIHYWVDEWEESDYPDLYDDCAHDEEGIY